jgi:methionine-rich copper-binding protein CopC
MESSGMQYNLPIQLSGTNPHEGQAMRKVIQTGVLLAAVVGVPLAARPYRSEADLHLRLVKSVPAKDSVLAEPPTHVMLWFSQEPQTRLSAITLRGPGGVTVAMGPVTQCPTEKELLFAKVDGPMPAGAYTVAWRTASSDGHVIRGEVAFRVR